MRRRIIQALLAAAAAGGVLLTVGLAGPHTSAYPVIYTSSQGGYTASGRWFRFVATTVKVPGASPYAQYAEAVLGGVGVSPVTAAIKPGGGQASVGWADGGQPFGKEGGTLNIAPKPGDTVLIDLYYKGSSVAATTEDTTTGRRRASPGG